MAKYDLTESMLNNLQQLNVGDLLQAFTDQGYRIGMPQLFISNADGLNTPPQHKSISSGVASNDMPVEPVSFNCQIVIRKVKVKSIPTNRVLLNEAQTQRQEGQADGSFNAGFSGSTESSASALVGAKPLLTGGIWNYQPCFAAKLTDEWDALNSRLDRTLIGAIAL